MAGAIDPAHLELILKTMGIENVKEVTKAYEDLAKTAKSTVQPLEEAEHALAATNTSVAPVSLSLEELSGTGEGESGKGGLAGVAAGVLKFEKALLGFSTGRGLRGATVALEGLIGTLGGPLGVGLAVGAVANALDILLPKFEKWINGLDGVAESAKKAADALKEHNDQVERQAQQVEKLMQQPTAEAAATAAGVTGLLGEGRARPVKAGIAAGLEAQKFGLTGGEEVQLQHAIRMVAAAQQTGEAGGFDIGHWGSEVRRLQNKRSQAIEEESNRWILELPTNERVQQAVMGMPQVPEEFRTRMAGTTPEARASAKRQAQEAEATSAWGEQTYKAREEAHEENLGIQQQFNKALRDKRKDEADQRDRDDAVAEAAKEADERNAEKAHREADRAHAKDELARKRASTPLAQMTRGVREFAPGLEAEGFDVEGIAHEALRQLPATRGNAAVAIQQAILAAYQRGLRMQQEDMARMQMFSEMMQGSR